MHTLPAEIMVVLHHFAPVLSERIWDWVPVLVVGGILTANQRTVTRVLRIMGLSGDGQFQTYHRVLNRALVGFGCQWHSAGFVGERVRPGWWRRTQRWNEDGGSAFVPKAIFVIRCGRVRSTAWREKDCAG